MRKFAFGTALLSLVAGGVGFILRHLYLTRAIEPDTGLPVSGATSTIALVFYTVFILLLSLALAYIVKRNFRLKEKYREIIMPANTFYLIAMGAVYTCLVVAGCIEIAGEISSHIIVPSQLIRAILVALTGACLFGLTYEAVRGRDFKLSLLYSIVPEIAMTFWLLIYYRANQTNPVLMDYVFVALALASSTFGFYFTAGYVYGRRAPMRLIFSYAAAIFFLTASLADSMKLTDKLCFAGLALFFIVNLSQFVGNLIPKSRKAVEEAASPVSDGLEAAE